MAAKLTRIWMAEYGDRRELRLDWSNDRHHAVMVHVPCGPEQVVDALRELAALVASDSRLST